jgi:hypothetical protein
MLERFFAHTEETDAQLATLASSALALMLGAIKPLGDLLTRLPVGADHADLNAAELRAVLRERLPAAAPRGRVGAARRARARGSHLLQPRERECD